MSSKPAEFATVEQMEAHIAALEAEADYCATSSKAANVTAEQRDARTRRAKEAKAEVARIRKENRADAKSAAADDEGEAAES